MFWSKRKKIVWVTTSRFLLSAKDEKILIKAIKGFQKEVFHIRCDKDTILKCREAITHFIYSYDSGENELLGFMRFEKSINRLESFPETCLDWFYIIPKYRRLKVGTKAINMLIKEAYLSNQSFFITVDNLKAEQFFNSIPKLKKQGRFYFFNI